MKVTEKLLLYSRVLDDEEKFIKQLLFSSKNIVSNDDFLLRPQNHHILFENFL